MLLVGAPISCFSYGYRLKTQLFFDADRSSFVFDDVEIGAETLAEQMANTLGVTVRHKPDDNAWCFVEASRRTMSAIVSFHEGRVHSGFFWVNTRTAGWHDYEQVENTRRAEHERLMNEMFEASCYQDGVMSVRLARDPRSGLEQITFQMLRSDVR